MNDALLNKIAITRRRERTVGLASAMALGVGYLVFALSIGMFMDWLIELPFAIRALLLSINTIALGWIAYQLAIYRLMYPSDDETLALAVERSTPRFEGRLISSIQLAQADAIPSGTSRALVTKMLQQTVSIADEVDFTAAIKAERLIRQSSLAAAVLVLGIVGFVAMSSACVPLLERAFLMRVAVPRKTHILPISRDVTIAVGDSFTITARAQGIKPSSGKAVLQYASGAVQDIEMNQLRGDSYSGLVSNIQEPVKYTVYLGDNHGETYRINTAARPEVTNIKCWQVFPAYTHLPPQPRAPGDLEKLLRGSRLILSVDASKTLKVTTTADATFNRAHLDGMTESDQPLIVNPSGNETFDGQPASAASDSRGILLPGNTSGISIFLVDANGIESQNPAVYPISMIDKNKPSIKLVSPKESEILALPTDAVLLEYEAHDDFALGGLSLHFKRAGDPAENVVQIPLSGSPADARDTFAWQIASLKSKIPSTNPTNEDTIFECWLRATDTDDVSNPDHQPNFGESEHFQIRIATQEEIDAHLHEMQHRTVGVIGTITQEQQQTNDDFSHNVLRTAPASQPAEKQ